MFHTGKKHIFVSPKCLFIMLIHPELRVHAKNTSTSDDRMFLFPRIKSHCCYFHLVAFVCCCYLLMMTCVQLPVHHVAAVTVASVSAGQSSITACSIAVSGVASVVAVTSIAQQGVAETVDAADASSETLSETAVHAVVEAVEFTLVETVLLTVDKAVEGSLQVSVVFPEGVPVACTLVDAIDCSLVIALYFTLYVAGLLTCHESFLLSVEFSQRVRIHVATETAHGGVAHARVHAAYHGRVDGLVELDLGGLDGLHCSGWVTQYCRQAHRQHHQHGSDAQHDHRLFPKTKTT